MHKNAALIDSFYRHFAARNADGMVACYHPNVVFSDVAFGRLEGERAGMMWRMLTQRAADLVVEHSAVTADDAAGSAHWEAHYTFSQTGRKVHNVIEARFVFRDGLIAEHHDTFEFYRWSKMALGPVGLLLGWTPILRNAVRKKANQGLDQFIARRKR
jgi:ketosteroid isomerase-like protein